MLQTVSLVDVACKCSKSDHLHASATMLVVERTLAFTAGHVIYEYRQVRLSSWIWWLLKLASSQITAVDLSQCFVRQYVCVMQ